MLLWGNTWIQAIVQLETCCHTAPCKAHQRGVTEVSWQIPNEPCSKMARPKVERNTLDTTRKKKRLNHMENMLPPAAGLGYAMAPAPPGTTCMHGREPEAFWSCWMGQQPGKSVQIRSSSMCRETKKLNGAESHPLHVIKARSISSTSWLLLVHQALLRSSQQRGDPLPGQGDVQANLSPAQGAEAASPRCFQCEKEGSGRPGPQQDRRHRKHGPMAGSGLSLGLSPADHISTMPPGMCPSSTAHG